MDVSNQMLVAVANAKNQAKSAERQFDFAAEMINIESSSSIDLLGGRAVSQVADIASSVRKACDELYASYQSLVLMLDQQCRPLLSQKPSTRAVKEVMEMIKWLNKESEIGSNFSGSLNGFSLGDLVNVKYFASMDCQMIQKHWENVYSTMPGREEENRAFQQRQKKEHLAAIDEERKQKQMLRDLERQERKREQKEQEEGQRKRLEHSAKNAAATAARREYLKSARGMLGASSNTYAFVKPDGTVEAFHIFGTPCDVSHFTNIQAVVCLDEDIVGLRNNGTCIATNPKNSCNAYILETNQWRGIRELAAGDHHIIGLRNDGTCVATSIKRNSIYGNSGQCDVSEWRDITAIACGDYFTMGLKSDGTIAYAGDDVAQGAKSWKDIALIAANGSWAVGVTKEGKVVSAGKVITDAIEWAEDIIQLGIARGNAYALQADGTVVGGRQNKDNPTQKVILAKNIVAMATSNVVLVLKEDGHVHCCGGLPSSVDIPYGYRLFNSYDRYVKDKVAAEEARKQREQQRNAYRNAGVCQHCGGTFKKSFFSCKCTQCGTPKDY